VKTIVEKQMECTLAGKTEVLGGSGTTIRHNTQTTLITQNNRTIKRNTVYFAEIHPFCAQPINCLQCSLLGPIQTNRDLTAMNGHTEAIQTLSHMQSKVTLLPPPLLSFGAGMAQSE
jgi:hypothetical protein